MLCAVQVVIPSELMLVSLPRHIIFLWCQQRGVLVTVEKDRRGTVDPPVLNCGCLRVHLVLRGSSWAVCMWPWPPVWRLKGQEEKAADGGSQLQDQ